MWPSENGSEGAELAAVPGIVSKRVCCAEIIKIYCCSSQVTATRGMERLVRIKWTQRATTSGSPQPHTQYSALTYGGPTSAICHDSEARMDPDWIVTSTCLELGLGLDQCTAMAIFCSVVWTNPSPGDNPLNVIKRLAVCYHRWSRLPRRM